MESNVFGFSFKKSKSCMQLMSETQLCVSKQGICKLGFGNDLSNKYFLGVLLFLLYVDFIQNCATWDLGKDGFQKIFFYINGAELLL